MIYCPKSATNKGFIFKIKVIIIHTAKQSGCENILKLEQSDKENALIIMCEKLHATLMRQCML